MASPLSREIFIGDKYSPKPDFGRNAFVAAVPCARREGMAKRDDAALKLLRWELEGHGKAAMSALRRRLRALALQAAFWSELAAGHKESNAIALVILRKGREVLAKAGETAYLDQPEVAEMIRRESERRAKGTYVLHLPVGRLVVMTGEGASIAALFRRAPGKDVVQVLVKTVEAIEENKAAATKTFGNEKLAGKYAEALLKLLQKTSI